MLTIMSSQSGLLLHKFIIRNSGKKPLFFTATPKMSTDFGPHGLEAVPHSLLVTIRQVAGMESATRAERMTATDNGLPSVMAIKKEQVSHPLMAFVRSVDAGLTENPSDGRNTFGSHPL
jgi:hypothetical protein